MGERVGVRNRVLVFDFRKRIQTMEFMFEFEFQQPEIMLQHECNN
jgi:hypothetical protein